MEATCLAGKGGGGGGGGFMGPGPPPVLGGGWCVGAGGGGAGGAFSATGPTAMLASGCDAGAVERLFSSTSSLRLLQFLSVWDDLISPRSFRNPCMVHGPSSCSFAVRGARAPSRGCLGHHSRFCCWGSSSWFSL